MSKDITTALIGKLLTEDQRRDAIHIAVAPMVAGEKLYPGQDVGMVGEDVAGRADSNIGIVDPFLKAPVFPGQRCWIFLYPLTITSLRHEWTHPAFAAGDVMSEALRAASEAWLRDFAADIGLTYSEVIHTAENFIRGGEYHTFQGRDTPERCYTDKAAFWHHYEVVSGERLESRNELAAPFSCSC